jgi:kynurenine formamidase
MTACLHDHSRWGAADRVGAANHLTDATRLAAIQLVKQGKVYDLSHVIRMGAPAFVPVQPPYLMSMWQTSRDSQKRRAAIGATNNVGSNLERIEMTVHVGTHIDALGHFSIGDYLYGGRSAYDTVSDFGLVELGAEHIPPIIARAVLLDVAGLDGGTHLEKGRALTADDLKRACDKAKLEIRPADVVLLRTGWGRFFMADNARYVAGEPGIEEGAARWLTGQGVVAIGADNMAVEAIPNPRHPEISMPVHQHTLAEAGVYLIENLALDQVAAAGLTQFCFILLSVKFKGATGCPVRPVALL